MSDLQNTKGIPVIAHRFNVMTGKIVEEIPLLLVPPSDDIDPKEVVVLH